MKVVIPNNLPEWQKMSFLPPRSQYEFFAHNIWGKDSSDATSNFPKASDDSILRVYILGQHDRVDQSQ